MPEPTYTLTIGTDTMPQRLDEFLAANELDAEEVEAIRALKPGETYRSGGGAGCEWAIERTS